MTTQKIGYARVSTLDQNLEAIKLYDAGQHTIREIEELTNVKKATLYRALKDQA